MYCEGSDSILPHIFPQLPHPRTLAVLRAFSNQRLAIWADVGTWRIGLRGLFDDFGVLGDDFVPGLVHGKLSDEAEGGLVVACVEHAFH